MTEPEYNQKHRRYRVVITGQGMVPWILYGRNPERLLAKARRTFVERWSLCERAELQVATSIPFQMPRAKPNWQTVRTITKPTGDNQ